MPNLSTDHSNAVLVENEDFKTGATRKDRFASFAAADFEVPNGQEEDWRFTPMDRVGEFFDAERPLELPLAVPHLAGYTVLVTGSGCRLREVGDQPAQLP